MAHNIDMRVLRAAKPTYMAVLLILALSGFLAGLTFGRAVVRDIVARSGTHASTASTVSAKKNPRIVVIPGLNSP